MNSVKDYQVESVQVRGSRAICATSESLPVHTPRENRECPRTQTYSMRARPRPALLFVFRFFFCDC